VLDTMSMSLEETLREAIVLIDVVAAAGLALQRDDDGAARDRPRAASASGSLRRQHERPIYSGPLTNLPGEIANFRPMTDEGAV
jgi:hypothetical protein